MAEEVNRRLGEEVNRRLAGAVGTINVLVLLGFPLVMGLVYGGTLGMFSGAGGFVGGFVGGVLLSALTVFPACGVVAVLIDIRNSLADIRNSLADR